MMRSRGGIAHWDDVESFRRAKGEMDATWQPLGHAAGAETVGVNRVRIEPGKLPTPPHSHGASEELFFVLGGSGLAWQDEAVYEVRPGDCVVQRPNEMEHTFAAGPDGLEYLVYGTNHPTELGWLPRSRAIRLGWPWVEGRTDDPWDVEAQVEPLALGEAAERPPNIVNADDVEGAYGGRLRGLAGAAGSKRTGLNLAVLAAGEEGAPAHCHSAEEEVFVVLEGDGTLTLIPSPVRAAQGAEEEQHALRRGHIVARPPGTGMAHVFTAGDKGITYLAYGTRDFNDILYYPRSNKFFLKGIGLIGRVEPLDYYDGEAAV
jgi:uncharacterized cupin superfamily protein